MASESVKMEHVFPRATPEQVYKVVTDYAAYPRMFPEFTACKVHSQNGNVFRVEFVASVVVEVSYILDIVHDDAVPSTEWTFVSGKVVSESRGGWKFVADGANTKVLYHASIGVNAPLPGFIVNKVSNMLLKKSVPMLFANVEKELSRRRGA